MNKEKHDLIGKQVIIFPHDTYEKIAIIENVDEYGFYFKIKYSRDKDFQVNDVYFYNHSTKISFKFY